MTSAIGKACRIEPREYTKPNEYVPIHHYVETMTDKEIQHKLCKDVHGGCRECGVNDVCRYGKEAMRRKLV